MRYLSSLGLLQFLSVHFQGIDLSHLWLNIFLGILFFTVIGILDIFLNLFYIGFVSWNFNCIVFPLVLQIVTVYFSSAYFSSVIQSCLTLCDPTDCSTSGFPIHHQLLELSQTHVHRVGDSIQPPHSLSSPSPPAFNLSQNQGLFKWLSSSHQVAKVLEL